MDLQLEEQPDGNGALVIAVFAGLNALLLLILSFKIPFATGIYFWSSLVWFAFYFYGRRLASSLQISTACRRRQLAAFRSSTDWITAGRSVMFLLIEFCVVLVSSAWPSRFQTFGQWLV